MQAKGERMIIKLKGVQKSYEHVNEWVNNLMKRFEFRDNNEAFAMLKATLWALRDRVPNEEAIQLGAQLPVLLRGYYYEDWKHDPHRGEHADNFYTKIQNHLKGYENLEVEKATPIVLKFIFEKISQGEAQDVKDNLPKDLQQMVM
jgi:uncharacterized protein (DUF2267 family)